MSDPPTAKKKYQGTVKWFSNRKGYGFITPGKDDDGCPITDDIFVHQSTIHSEGYRTLSEGWVVEFAVGHDDDGKAKAEDVTAPGGGYVTGPRRPPHPRSRRRRSPRKDRDDDDDDDDDAAPQEGNEGKEGEEKASAGGGGGGRRGGGGRHRGPRTSSSGGGNAPPPPPHWHDSLSSDVKSTLQSKGVRTSTGTLDVSLGTSRIKLGTRGYASVADSRAVLAEGSFECDGEGKATFAWKRSIAFAGGEWKTMDDGERGKVLPGSLTLGDDAVGAVGTDETASTLWGESVTDPRPALESNGFEMRRVVLTTKRR